MSVDKLFFDTESVGYYGPTVLIQYCINDGPAILHNIWETPVQSTLDLIESHQNYHVYAFNLTHDWFHYTRTYNVLSNLPRGKKPNPLDYYYAEKESLDKYCLRPRAACDLLLVGKKTKFQASMNQKKIVIRKVPTVLSEFLVKTLTETIEIPSIYFAKTKKGYHWDIVQLLKNGREATDEEAFDPEDLDLNFVNLHLNFAPSTALKDIMEYIGKGPVDHYEDLMKLPKVKEYSWYPAAGDWLDVIDMHLFAWRTDTRRITYAKNDPIYNRELYYYLDCPEAGDIDSELAVLIGGAHWRGYQINRPRCERRRKRVELFYKNAPININSPRQVKKWLCDAADQYEKQALLDTRAETLKKISDEWKEDNPELARRCKYITRAKRAFKEVSLIDRLITAGRMHAVYKTIGTKSNRMSGGSENYIKNKNGSLNPQGIPKGPGIRSLFLLANAALGEELHAGDFSGFEVSIADAVYGDPILRQELLSGKKIHALFGAEMYGKTYEEIMATEMYGINDPLGLYQRAKRGFFAMLYGAEADKISVSMWLTKEEAEKGLFRFFDKYKVIRDRREELRKRFTSLIQKGDIGSKIEYQAPADYIESFLGFRRYFTLENNIIRSVYALAQDPPPEFKVLGSKIKVTRRDRTQTASGATMSALYAIAFGLQGSIFRAAANHEMQSPGGELTKRLQFEIWSFQPTGIGPWRVMPLNVHDEIETPTAKEIASAVKQRVDETVLSFRQYVPLIKMKYGKINHWGEK